MNNNKANTSMSAEKFIYGIFDDNYLRTPDNKGKENNILGYFNNKLLEVRWTTGSSRICFAFVSTNENHVDYMTELPKFKEYVENNMEAKVETFISGNWLICDFVD